jgi:uncharacterized Ntn-hydrolase superfamily protein
MTYSIVARDKETGNLGVAVQSHYFGVGRLVPWGIAGVGVVATQSFVEPAYGLRGLELLKNNYEPLVVLEDLLELDPGAETRQVSILNSEGIVATHTGRHCIEAAGHVIGDGVSVQANLVESEKVWISMIEQFESSSGSFASKLLNALKSAESMGGDIRGRQSSAILIVRGEATGRLRDDRVLDLRVDDSIDPLIELERLIKNSAALDCLVELLETDGLFMGELTVPPHVVESALLKLSEAQLILGPSNCEASIWRGLLLGRAGRDFEAVKEFSFAFECNSRVPVLIRRLSDSGMWNRSKEALEKLLEF